MLVKEKSERNTLEIVSVDLYCEDNGWPGVAPVVMFKKATICDSRALSGFLRMQKKNMECGIRLTVV